MNTSAMMVLVSWLLVMGFAPLACLALIVGCIWFAVTSDRMKQTVTDVGTFSRLEARSTTAWTTVHCLVLFLAVWLTLMPSALPHLEVR